VRKGEGGGGNPSKTTECCLGGSRKKSRDGQDLKGNGLKKLTWGGQTFGFPERQWRNWYRVEGGVRIVKIKGKVSGK